VVRGEVMAKTIDDQLKEISTRLDELEKRLKQFEGWLRGFEAEQDRMIDRLNQKKWWQVW
jgi:hypothetical protein